MKGRFFIPQMEGKYPCYPGLGLIMRVKNVGLASLCCSANYASDALKMW